MHWRRRRGRARRSAGNAQGDAPYLCFSLAVQSLVRSIYGGFLEKSLSVIEVHLPHSQKLYFEAMVSD